MNRTQATTWQQKQQASTKHTAIRRAVSHALRQSRPILLAGCVAVVGAAGGMQTANAQTAFPPVIELADLDGSNGFVLNGLTIWNGSGRSVSGAGDINGDGIDDVIIGSPYAYSSSVYSSGASYVVFGRDTAVHGEFSASFELSELDGSNGFKVSGVNHYDWSGMSVSGAGDINGDGIADLIIGAKSVFDGEGFGASYVVFGRDTTLQGNFPAAIELASLDGSNGFVLNGVNKDDRSGGSVSGAGDINGDGFADLIIGATGADPNGDYSGASYVVFGRNTIAEGDFPAMFELSALDGSNGFSLNGASEGDYAGRSVTGAGDINGDGISDLLIGAPAVKPNGSERAGASYVVFGRNTALRGDFPAAIELTSLDGRNGFVLNGVSKSDRSGDSVSDAGDINGDGIADLVIGATGADPNGDVSGASYVVFGRNTIVGGDFPAMVELSALDGSNGFSLNGASEGDGSGWSVTGAGDINGDGISDLLIGAPSAKPNGSEGAGTSYVVFGRDTALHGDFPAAIELASLDGRNGFVLNGVNKNDRSGRSVSGAGDINGDGFADLIIGAPGANPNGSDSGASYVVFGGPSLTSDNPQSFAQCPGDINDDDVADIAMVMSDGSVKLKDLNRELVSQFEFSDIDRVVDVVMMPDINNNDAAELVVLGAESATVEIRDSLTGESLSSVEFHAIESPAAVALVDDQTGDGVPELAVAGRGLIEVRGAMNGKLVSSVPLNTYFDPVDLSVVPDFTGDGVPELQVLGNHRVEKKSDKIEVHSLYGGVVLHEWFNGRGWDLPQQALVLDVSGNGDPEVALLRNSQTIDYTDVLLRNVRVPDPAIRGRRVGFDPMLLTIRLRSIGDINGNGADEIVFLGQREDTDYIKAVVKDGASLNRINAIYFAKDVDPIDLVTCPDMNGNGSDELAVVGRRNSDGKLRVNVKDPKTNESLGRVAF